MDDIINTVSLHDEHVSEKVAEPVYANVEKIRLAGQSLADHYSLVLTKLAQ